MRGDDVIIIIGIQVIGRVRRAVRQVTDDGNVVPGLAEELGRGGLRLRQGAGGQGQDQQQGKQGREPAFHVFHAENSFFTSKKMFGCWQYNYINRFGRKCLYPGREPEEPSLWHPEPEEPSRRLFSGILKYGKIDETNRR